MGKGDCRGGAVITLPVAVSFLANPSVPAASNGKPTTPFFASLRDSAVRRPYGKLPGQFLVCRQFGSCRCAIGSRVFFGGLLAPKLLSDKLRL